MTKTVSSCFAALRQIRSIRRSVSRSVLKTLIVALVHTRLDYCCSLFSHLPDCLLRRLQTVLNSGARLIFNSRFHDPITPLLKDLLWLPIRERISFRLSVLVFRCLHGSAPSYLSQQLTPLSKLESRHRLRSASTSALATRRTRRKTIGGRAFPVTASRTWNSLPPQVTSASSLSLFKLHARTFLLKSLSN